MRDPEYHSSVLLIGDWLGVLAKSATKSSILCVVRMHDLDISLEGLNASNVVNQMVGVSFSTSADAAR